LALIVSCVATVAATLTWTAPSPAAAAPRPKAPVVTISARVVDIVVSTADPERKVRVDRSRASVRVTFDATVLFGKDSAALRSSSATRLSGVTDELRRRGAGRVRIVGYTDDLGSDAHGRALSRRRALSVAAVLRGELPADTYPFTVIGRGEAEPAVPNTSEANRRINRRVVVTYLAG
jgi:outer membrane protein OmpA-like peptidoglycan-associated protein